MDNTHNMPEHVGDSGGEEEGSSVNGGDATGNEMNTTASIPTVDRLVLDGQFHIGKHLSRGMVTDIAVMFRGTVSRMVRR